MTVYKKDDFNITLFLYTVTEQSTIKRWNVIGKWKSGIMEICECNIVLFNIVLTVCLSVEKAVWLNVMQNDNHKYLIGKGVWITFWL